MKPFNLNEYLRLKEEGKEPKIVTRRGRSARIICTDRKDPDACVVALVNECGVEIMKPYHEDGSYLNFLDHAFDLFFADHKEEPKYRPYKEEPKYRPYKDAEECFKDVVKHGGWVLLEGNLYRQITGIRCLYDPGIVKVSGRNWTDFEGLLKAVWADDGTPCGVKED